MLSTHINYLNINIIRNLGIDYMIEFKIKLLRDSL
jgi:hypothetical protein